MNAFARFNRTSDYHDNNFGPWSQGHGLAAGAMLTMGAALLSLVFLASCAEISEDFTVPTGGSSSAKSASELGIPPDAPMAELFGMNGIAPFHHHVSTDPKEKENLWPEHIRRLQMANELGAKSMRMDLWWGIIEPEKDKFDWSVPDRAFEEIVKAGLEPYPILCYASAWSKDVSPDTPEERERFGKYVFATVSRFKDKAHRWEIWNEPNITPFWSPRPDAELYAELLKVAYREAKKADPACEVVGICAAGPDYDFIEKVYQQGSSKFMDAVSFHHYDDKMDEAVLENEILKIRRIMQRWGDGAKPLYITELGLLTGPDPIGMKPYLQEEQASWIVKKYMVSADSGAQRVYYFCMNDWKPGKKADGQWGLYLFDKSPKRSGVAYKAMTQRLADARRAGRAYGLEDDAKRSGEAEVLLFEKTKRRHRNPKRSPWRGFARRASRSPSAFRPISRSRLRPLMARRSRSFNRTPKVLPPSGFRMFRATFARFRARPSRWAA